ncbi:MAG: LPS assembly protein LptD [Desulfobulbaceae bacterium]|nr:LPS assembly protein LptD [Desulfobulbaceae bacterium]
MIVVPGSIAAPVGNPWEITADRITRFEDPAVIVAEGNVVLQRSRVDAGGTTVINADWVRYDLSVGEVEARGHLVLKSDTEQVEASAAQLDLNSQIGTLEDATLIIDHGEYFIRISGSTINKTGEDTYTVKDSRITTCPPKPGKVMPWVVKSKDVRVKKNGMAVLKPATLLIREKPVLYTPYLTFPAKIIRESGFLFPEVSASDRDGVGLIAPYFVNISPSVDATLYPGYYAERGVFAGVEFRYVADARSRGTFGLNYLHDKKEETLADDFNSDGILRGDENRYWLHGKVDHDFGENMIGKFDLDFVSDQDFLQEFGKGMSGFDVNNRQALNDYNRGYQEESVTQRKSTMQLVKSWSTMSVLGGLTVIQDAKEVRSAITPAQALPSIRFNGRQQLGQSHTNVVWGSEYLYYYRKQGIGYHRVDLFPKLVWSIPRGYFEGTVSGGVRETMYQVEVNGDPALSSWNQSDRQDRTVQYYDVSIASPWVRDFDFRVGEINTLTHTLRPQLDYGYTPNVDQDSLPYIDGEDRVAARNQFTYALKNYFRVTETGSNGESRKREFGLFNLQQSYNVRETNRDLLVAGDVRRPFSDILLETEISPWAGLSLSYDSAWSVYGQGNTFYQFLAGYSSLENQRLSLSYTFQKNPTVRKPFYYSGVTPNSERKLTAVLDSKLTDSISLRGSIDQRRQAGNNHVDQTVMLTYQPSCWAASLLYSNTDEDQRVALMFSLTGIGDFVGLGLAGDGGVDYDFF